VRSQTHTHAHGQTLIHTRTHIHTYTHTCARTHTHTNARKFTGGHTLIHTHTHAYVRTCCARNGLCQLFSIVSDASPLFLVSFLLLPGSKRDPSCCLLQGQQLCLTPSMPQLWPQAAQTQHRWCQHGPHWSSCPASELWESQRTTIRLLEHCDPYLLQGDQTSSIVHLQVFGLCKAGQINTIFAIFWAFCLLSSD